MAKKINPGKSAWLAYLLVLLNTGLVFCQSTPLKLLSFKAFPCDERVDIFRTQNRIISQNIDSGVYNLSFGIVTNCAGIYSISADLLNDSLRISYENGRVVSDTATNGKISKELATYNCDCYIEFSIKIKGLVELPKIVKVDSEIIQMHADKYKTYPIKFTLKNNDTINLVDKYGLKQGVWYENEENKGYFTGYYINNAIKSADSKEYYSTGKLKSILFQTDFKKFRSENYFENGSLSLQILSNDSLGLISTRFYENGIIERIFVKSPGYNEEKLFYPDGHIKKITGNNIHQDYYPSGILKKEFSFVNENDISYRYYYENGYLMATHYIESEEKSKKVFNKKPNATGKIVTLVSTESWTEEVGNTWRYFDKNGKLVSKQSLISQGYSFLDAD